MTSSSSDRPRRLGEFALIAKLFAPLAKAEGTFGLTDDAATLRVPDGSELVLTVDTVVGGVHFFESDPADLIAKKALRVNFSDLAAKGAEPLGYLLAISLPAAIDEAWLTRFAAGLADDQSVYGVNLLGGDTTSTSGPLIFSITALGSVPKGKMLRRAGAKPGDAVFVSGTVGDAGAGLAVLKGEGKALSVAARERLVSRYRLPEPRLPLGRRLIGLASAALDVSDGLLADLGHIAETSGVRIVVEAGRVPVSPECKGLWCSGIDTVIRAATAGDDYEIAFCAPISARPAITVAAAEAGIAVQEIGRVEAGKGIELLDDAGGEIKIERPGYTHF